MPEIQYPKNPNSDTAFVVQEDGTKNRALMTAPQDTSTLELPKNANSCKGYVTVDGKKQRVILTADIGGGGGGSSVDYAKTVQRAETMPTADASNAGQQFLYSGESDATYTHGYIYENVATTTSSSASAEQTVGSTLSDIAVDLATLESFTGWTTDNSLQIFYTADGWSVDATSLGVTYTGTPNVGDAITITYTAESTSYAWTQIDVQPAPEALPDQTGQSGKFLTTDGTDASWSDKPLVNGTTASGGLAIGTTNVSTSAGNTAIGISSSIGSFVGSAVVVGNSATTQSSNCVSVGTSASTMGLRSIAVGYQAQTNAVGAIQISTKGTSVANNDANTFKVANANGNFEIMSADGTIPEARLADTTGASQGDVLTLDANGDAVWQAGGGGGGSLPSQTGNSGKFLTTDGTDASWGDALANKAVKNRSMLIGASATEDSSAGSENIGIGAGVTIDSFVSGSIAIGTNAYAKNYSIAIGYGAQTYSSGINAIAIGRYAYASANRAIQIGAGANSANNSDADTFKVANNNGNFMMMDANGNLPADRLASTTGLADGNYRLRLTMSNGTPTLSWVAE